MREPLRWIQAFLNQQAGNITRTFEVGAFYNKGPKVIICVDASPYGLGAWLTVEGVPQEHFADTISDQDCAILGIEDRSGSKGQQAFEAFALLVSMRLWLPRYKNQRVLVTLRGDNIAALVMVSKMQPRSKSLGVVARELALDIASATYSPDFVQHIQGVSNSVADSLSRKFQADKTYTLPSILRYSKEIEMTARPRSWWLTVPDSKEV